MNALKLIVSTLVVLAMSSTCLALTYKKHFLAAGVDPGPNDGVGRGIWGGGIIETWGVMGLQWQWVQIINKYGHEFQRATIPTGGPKFIKDKANGQNMPMPTGPGRLAAMPPIGGIGQVPNVGIRIGWNPQKIDIIDNHKKPNSASADIKVAAFNAGQKTIAVNNGGWTGGGPYSCYVKNVTVNNFVEVWINGTAVAGKPTRNDGCRYHSADSFAAVGFKHQELYQFGPPAGMVAELVNRPFMSAGARTLSTRKKKYGRREDPFYAVLTDISNGGDSIVSEQLIMNYTAEWNDAGIVTDENAISLTVFKDNPDSFASLSFDTVSSWVEEPYTYNALLTPDAGLTSSGHLPIEFWSIIDDGQIITATFDFSGLGRPYDYARVVVPNDLFEMEHDYALDIRNGDGGYEVAVPEPATIVLLCMGGLALLIWRRRSR